jgi:hypothetical protein
MASPKKQPLTANEVEADLAIIRNPFAAEKKRNRSGQAGGVAKGHIDGPFAPRLIEMLESPAYRVLSLSARRVLDRLEIEFARHGGRPDENGRLPCTYQDFVDYGVDRHAIGPAINEAIAEGFVIVTRPGSAGNAEYRQPALYLLTYRPFGAHQYVGNGWRRISTLEEAEAVAKVARARKGRGRACEFGRKGAAARWGKKQKSSDGKHTDVGIETIPTPVMENTPKSPKSSVMENTPHLDFGGGPLRSMRDVAMPTPAAPPSPAVIWAEFSPSTPRQPASVGIAAPRKPDLDVIVEPIEGSYLIGARRIEVLDQTARRNVVGPAVLHERPARRTALPSNAPPTDSARRTVDVPTPNAPTSSFVH